MNRLLILGVTLLSITMLTGLICSAVFGDAPMGWLAFALVITPFTVGALIIFACFAWAIWRDIRRH